ncbi:SMI1/KNR4 family protein [Calycomorphotria hydatis]|uniref:SMI1 / KNR4 family protein n=1 Tax=Calycomorphotria hydatis TaxID=2528027 RepID=A0A517T406_9PLAN|nr:SMI1/KNR4 family protein [Calycomorphotria hydatis]QDT63105.1 SMI1 / KNR4 family protein [Calycomorphotria hydatis]
MRNLIQELNDLKSADTLSSDEELNSPQLFPPLSESQVKEAEHELGFQLTDTLRRIFTGVANGGFGPQYGLLGLKGGMRNEDGKDVVGQYLSYRQPDPDDEFWQWPEALLPLGQLGCAMYLCVDCSTPQGPVTWFEPNSRSDIDTPWDDAFIPFADSTEEWLFSWIDGDDLFDRHVNDG